MDLLQPDAGGGRVNHRGCSQTAGFSRDALRLGSYHSSPQRQSTQIRSLWALSMSSGWEISWHEKCLFFGCDHTDLHMIKALKQSSKFLVVCVFSWERSDHHQGRASPLSGVCWNKSCISSGARQHTLSLPAVCHAALLHSTHHLLPWLLSDSQRSASCFYNSSGTDGWHSCFVGPHGLLKKAINQSRRSTQAGNWPIRVAQDAYVQADDFTNWLSIYTNTQALHKKNSLAAVSVLMFWGCFCSGNRHHT